ncbi:nuclear transport factor 2 family protein [Jatrophihabitans sp. YIM 134969]
MTNHTASRSEQLPSALREFFTAHVVHDADTAVQFLADDVVAVDMGQTWRGRDQVYLFVRDAGAEFEVTTEELGTRRIDDAHFIIAVRLTGNFPGGVAELDYRFTLEGGLITEIVIGDHEA